MSIAAFEVNSPGRHHGCVVGLGLVGQQIVREMTLQFRATETLAVNWDSAPSIIDVLSGYMQRHSVRSLDVVWSAGKCGFGAADVELESEFNVYQSVMAWLAQQPVSARVNFLSSAGGLYEDAGLVTSIDDLAPARPYGHWKLKQEQLFRTLGLECRIFRASSVYGPRRKGGRAGLVNTILDCSRQSRPVTIFASENTLRDYVWSQDIARHIVERIQGKPGEVIEILAYGFPTSCHSLLCLAKTITRRHVQAIFVENSTNSKDIVIDSSLVPPRLVRTDLWEGLRLLHRALESA